MHHQSTGLRCLCILSRRLSICSDRPKLHSVKLTSAHRLQLKRLSPGRSFVLSINHSASLGKYAMRFVIIVYSILQQYIRLFVRIFRCHRCYHPNPNPRLSTIEIKHLTHVSVHLSYGSNVPSCRRTAFWNNEESCVSRFQPCGGPYGWNERGYGGICTL